MEPRTLTPRARTERRSDPPPFRPQVQRAIDPATFDVLGSVPLTPEAQMPNLVKRARRAFEGWRALPHAARREPLRALRNLILRRSEAIAEAVARGMGKPLAEALDFDVAMVVDQLDDYLAHGPVYLADEQVPLPASLGPGKRARIRQEPRGVVAVIAPWNFPFELAMTPALSALAAGNAVILKPTSSAPMVGELIEELFTEAFREHPGLAQVVQGPGRLGSVLATAEGVDFVVFTGSTQVGRKLQAELAPLLRPALLELGGCDPMIVCEDANLERAAAAAVFGRFCNNGQVCAAVKRIYVHRSVARIFLERVVAQVKNLRLGSPLDPRSDLGPLANDRALASLRSLLHDALDRGAKLEAGGFPAIQSGWYWPPTVLSQVDHSMRIMKEEAFGPILPIQAVDSDEEAIRLANDNDYGLDAYVFSGDLARAEAIAARLEAGSVDINDVIVNYVVRDLPFGGIKQSGINRYHGPGGLRLFCQPKAMVVDPGHENTEPHWFPHTADKLETARRRLSEK